MIGKDYRVQEDYIGMGFAFNSYFKHRRFQTSPQTLKLLIIPWLQACFYISGLHTGWGDSHKHLSWYAIPSSRAQ